MTKSDPHATAPSARMRALPHGPRVWIASAIAGLALGGVLALGIPPVETPVPTVAIWLVAPFALLLMCIALMPFVNRPFWHQHYPDVALLLGGITTGYYLVGFNEPYHSHGLSFGGYSMLHAGIEYYAFMALVGGLYLASAGVLMRIEGRAGPLLNAAILAFGAVLANVVGTTGASVLLIRPFMRVNKGRIRPIHVVFFIFIVSNCGGCITPIGDPPLYLGFLKGVPFEWTILNLWPAWATCIGLLLALFVVIDARIMRSDAITGRWPEQPADAQPVSTSASIRGSVGIIGLALIVAGVFIDPALKRFAGVEGYPIGATFQIIVAVCAYRLSDHRIREANGFSFEPLLEVGLLFLGIFATMVPALGYLAHHGSELGLDSPTSYYFFTGSLSAVLDNAPTYLNFMQVAFSSEGLELNPESFPTFIESPTGHETLVAISLGAVFFGAMTYIGNGPNFMVRAIAEASGVRMPSFAGYAARACVILLPVLFVVWAIFVR